MKNHDLEMIKMGNYLASECEITGQKLTDLLEIADLNSKYKKTWERLNNGQRFTEDETAKSETKMDGLIDIAEHIAKHQGWTISFPGLYWHVNDKKGNQINRVMPL